MSKCLGQNLRSLEKMNSLGSLGPGGFLNVEQRVM